MPLIAQVAEAGKAVDNLVRQSSEYGFVGALLVFVLVGFGGSLIILGRWLAHRDDLERAARQASDAKFTDELRRITDAFERQLSEHRKQSADLARSGHQAVNTLSAAFHELALTIAEDGTSLTKSQIMRRRDRGDSVFDG